MKSFTTYVNEKLKIKKQSDVVFIKSEQEFIDIIRKRTSHDGEYIDLSNLNFTEYNENTIPEFQSILNYQSIDNVRTIDVTGWVLGNQINSLSKLFCNLDTLTNIIGFDTIDLTNIVIMDAIFQSTGVETISLTNLNLENVSRLDNLFAYCQNLKTVDLSNWIVPNLEYCNGMFAQCPKLTTVEGLNTWNKTSIIDCKKMFLLCKSLQNINVNGFDVSQVKGVESMFEECTSLKYINISNWDFEHVYIMEKMFKGCKNLETVGTFPNPKNNKRYFYNCKEMFYDCKKLNLDLSNIVIIHRGRNQNFSKGTDPKLFKRPKFKV